MNDANGNVADTDLEALKEQLRALAVQAAVQHGAGNLEAAVELYRRMVELSPAISEVHSNLGVALFDLGRLDEAVAAFRLAIQLKPDSAEAHSNIGYALQEQGRHEEAAAALRRAIALKGDYAEAYSNLGNVLQQQGKTGEALEALHQATAVDPGHAKAHNNLAQILLRSGDYAAGWAEYEWRWYAVHLAPRSYAQPRWDGSPLAERTLLLYAEQGVGDTMQFVRYVPLVAALGGRVVLEVPRALVSLMEQLPATVVAAGDAIPAFDVHLPLMSLPRLFGTTVDTIPNQMPYLTPPPDRLAALAAPPAAAGLPRVGFAWAGNAQHPNDRKRSIPFRAIRPLLEVPGIQAFSLQVGRDGGEAAACGAVDLAPGLADFADTAAWIDRMDLCVCADTAVAHLAGAMGRPVWVLLPFAPDWRWMLDRADSPWYPTARLFRQASSGDWGDVVRRVAGELGRLGEGAS